MNCLYTVASYASPDWLAKWGDRWRCIIAFICLFSKSENATIASRFPETRRFREKERQTDSTKAQRSCSRFRRSKSVRCFTRMATSIVPSLSGRSLFSTAWKIRDVLVSTTEFVATTKFSESRCPPPPPYWNIGDWRLRSRDQSPACYFSLPPFFVKIMIPICWHFLVVFYTQPPNLRKLRNSYLRQVTTPWRNSKWPPFCFGTDGDFVYVASFLEVLFKHANRSSHVRKSVLQNTYFRFLCLKQHLPKSRWQKSSSQREI